MKLCKSNVFTTKIFVADPDRDVKIFRYDADRLHPRIVVTCRPEITIQDFSDQCYTEPFAFENEREFNLLAVRAILRACDIQGNITGSIEKAVQHFIDRDTPFGWILVSKDFVFTDPIYSLLCSMDMHGRFLRVAGLSDNQMLFTPIDDYLGVVSISGEDLDKYSIAVINSAGPILVELP